ncbi:TetR/AcrR family transcriptional regulator [Allokutzneria albata]|uniref:DNA-binding transcriptional regulator, AcrR family n=1 Tax=Allokutzneria albata TaxID=211114 RepID=A0A1G9UAS1_ALLAB|nr:TetR/AcrR family transcriptional regulator [Allokutzneria albata]SDM56932.1 DNA-binding transcriptional regulator, AcrR family [Allokutzneria albata]
MPRTAAQNEALRSASRETVFAHAVRIFARRGYAATSMRDVANEAGVSVGLIYRHYATKDDLFTDVLSRAATGLEETARELGESEDGYAALARFLERYLGGVADVDGAAEFSVVANQAFLSDEPVGARERLLASHNAFRQALETAVSRARRDGRFPIGDTASVVAVLLCLLSGAVTMRMASGPAAVPSAEMVLRLLDGGDR